MSHGRTLNIRRSEGLSGCCRGQETLFRLIVRSIATERARQLAPPETRSVAQLGEAGVLGRWLGVIAALVNAYFGTRGATLAQEGREMRRARRPGPRAGPSSPPLLPPRQRGFGRRGGRQEGRPVGGADATPGGVLLTKGASKIERDLTVVRLVAAYGNLGEA